MYEEDEWALAALRERYRAFTVDEYQDVNLLQQSLLELWLGDERGALRGRRRLPVDLRVHRRVARVAARPGRAVPVRDCRAARGELPLVAGGAVAREPARAAARRRGEDAAADAALGAGAASCAGSPRPRTRARSCSSACGRWRRRASRYEEMAVLIRLNARSVDFEELFGDARIPFQGAALLARDGARQLLKALRGAGFGSLAEEVRRVAREQGWPSPCPDGVGERELVRQADLARLVQAGRGVRRRLADGRGVGSVAARALRPRRAGRRAPADAPPREGPRVRGGLHPARRGEGAAVQAGDAPAGRARRGAAAALRRDDAREAPSRADVGRASRAASWPSSASRPLRRRARRRAEEPSDPTYLALKRWRLERAKADEIPAYVVFHNSTLAEIAERRPQHASRSSRSVPGVGPGEARALRA